MVFLSYYLLQNAEQIPLFVFAGDIQISAAPADPARRGLVSIIFDSMLDDEDALESSFWFGLRRATRDLQFRAVQGRAGPKIRWSRKWRSSHFQLRWAVLGTLIIQIVESSKNNE